MCRGLAILWNFENGAMCSGHRSHTDTAIHFDISEDECIKFEMLVNDTNEDGYVVKLDEYFGLEDINYLAPNLQNCFTNTGKVKNNVYMSIMEDIKKDEARYLKYLLKHLHYATFMNGLDLTQSNINTLDVADSEINLLKGNSVKIKDVLRLCSSHISQIDLEDVQIEKDIEISNMLFTNKPGISNFISRLTGEYHPLMLSRVIKLAIKGYKED